MDASDRKRQRQRRIGEQGMAKRFVARSLQLGKGGEHG